MINLFFFDCIEQTSMNYMYSNICKMTKTIYKNAINIDNQIKIYKSKKLN